MSEQDKQPGRRYHHGDLRRALVEAGIAILEEEGLDALSLRACAARVGVSHAAPKNHFDGVTGLLTAICAEGFRRHTAVMRAGLDPALPREQRLARALDAYVSFARDNPALYRLMFSMSGVDRSTEEFGIAAMGSFAVLMEMCAGLDWPGSGLVPSNANTWLMMWSFLHGYSDLMLNGLFHPVRMEGGYEPVLAQCWPGFHYAPGADAEPASPETKWAGACDPDPS